MKTALFGYSKKEANEELETIVKKNSRLQSEVEELKNQLIMHKMRSQMKIGKQRYTGLNPSFWMLKMRMPFSEMSLKRLRQKWVKHRVNIMQMI